MKIRLLLLVFAAMLFFGCQKPMISNTNEQTAPVNEVTNTSVRTDDGDNGTAEAGADADQPTPDPVPVTNVNQAPEATPPAPPTASPTPKTAVDLSIPFTSQAPYGVWDELHGEACEEASMIMVAAFLKQETLTAHTADQAIISLVKWEEKNGYRIDVTAEETVAILRDYFSLNAAVSTDVTFDRIKAELNQGNIIIVPAAGRELGNPYFQNPGPIYHMLVIRGYENNKIITNDPGTRRGERYVYESSKLIGAIHDWDHALAIDGMTDSEINSTRKVMIIVTP